MIRILVVEDDRDISALIQLALKNAGYDVFAARGTGRQAEGISHGFG